MNKQILKAESEIKKAQTNYLKVVRSVQKKCKHPSKYVYEAEYRPETDYQSSLPPFRVCSNCGIAEVGWGIGYKFLPETKFLTIPRKDGETLIKHFINEEEKCKLAITHKHFNVLH